MYWIRRLVTITTLLSLVVVMVGAYTRLTASGLGCPDWPGCYGRIAPMGMDLLQSQKAWTEMIHRYCAGLVGLFIAVINIAVFMGNRQRKKLPWRMPLFLLGLVVFQALLGMWTVTLRLVPWVVLGHLLGGVLIFASLVYLRLELSRYMSPADLRIKPWITLGIFIILGQIALGGWVSSNYAGIACIGFPTCNGSWWPSIDWTHAFNFFLPIGINYEGGVLESTARVGIQWIHRLGALVVFLYILSLSAYLLQKRYRSLHACVLTVLILVLMQCALGVINVVYQLPIIAAVLHNGCAAMLLATMFAMRYRVRREPVGSCHRDACRLR